MMFKLNDKVKIKSSGIKGTVVDVSVKDGKPVYIVESDTENTPGGYGDLWKLYDCNDNELESTE